MKNSLLDVGKGILFSKHVPKDISPFEKVFDILKELLTHVSGDIDEAFDWLNTLDKSIRFLQTNIPYRILKKT